jgi:hypothetical protein
VSRRARETVWMVTAPPPEPSLEDRLASLVAALARDRDVLTEPIVARWSRLDRDSGLMVSGAMTLSESSAAEQVARMLEIDIRYEHLDKPKDAVYDLLARLAAEPTSDGFRWFRTKFSKPPQRRTCFLPVKHLSITEPFALFGIDLLPVGSALIPEERFLMTLEAPVGCVAMVAVEGTNTEKMRDRARKTTNRALRLLRVGLREYNVLNDRQLRFTLDDAYQFDVGVQGRTESSDRAYELDANPWLFEFVSQQAVWTLADAPSNELQENVERAAEWLERAMFESDAKVAALFAFFALEALLGEALQGPKGAPIAFRLMMLSHLADGTFLEPVIPALMYKHVRNDAVHGGVAVEVSSEDLNHLLLVVRFAIRQSLLLAAKESLTTKAELCRHLEGHADRPVLCQWLRERYGETKQRTPVKNLTDYACQKP